MRAAQDATGSVVSVHVGAPRYLKQGGRGYWSAIEKAAVRGPIAVNRSGLAGDRQADTRNHGGEDKAVHAHFVTSLRVLARLAGFDHLDPGRIGVNLALAAVEGSGELAFDETTVAIGDRYRVGPIMVEVTQPRIPCYKQANQLGADRGLVDAILRSGRTGLYFRVLEGGIVQAGDPVVLNARPHPEWPLTRVTALIAESGSREDWTALLALSALGSGLRETARSRLARLREKGAD